MRKPFVFTFLLFLFITGSGYSEEVKKENEAGAPLFVIAPFMEYQYVPNMGGPDKILSGVNDIIGSILSDYREMDIFNHVVLLGAEFRFGLGKIAGFPERLGRFEAVGSLAGTLGSASAIDKDYRETYTLLLPNDLTLVSDMGLDYYLTLEGGIRYEAPELFSLPIRFFALFTAGGAFLNGSMYFDIEGLVGTTHVKADYAASGLTLTTLGGVRLEWTESLSTSLSLGYAMGRISDRARIEVELPIVGVTTPFTADLDAELDGLKIRFVPISYSF